MSRRLRCVHGAAFYCTKSKCSFVSAPLHTPSQRRRRKFKRQAWILGLLFLALPVLAFIVIAMVLR